MPLRKRSEAKTPRARQAPRFVDFVLSIGAKLTDAQRVLALVAFDGVEPRELRGDDRQIARQLFGDVDRIDPIARVILAIVAGARSGKTWIAALYVFWRCVVADLSALAPGETGFALVLAPDMRLSRQLLRYVEGAARASHLSSMIAGTTTDTVTFVRPDGRTVTVEAIPVNRAGTAARGRSLLCAVIDESAFLLDENYVAADVHSFNAVAPRVIPNGMVLVQSTPWARAGLLFDLIERNHGHPSDAVAVRAPTALMRAGDPGIAAMLERERRRDERNFAREYGADFFAEEGALFDPSDIDACVDRGVTIRPPQSEVSYGMSIDVGLRRDWTSILVFHVSHRKRENAPPLSALVIDAVKVLKPGLFSRISLDDVEAAIVALASRYDVAFVGGDIHYADAIGPRLRERGLEFKELAMAPAAQARRAETLVARVAARSIRLIDHPDLVKQLKQLREVRHAGGRTSVGAPERKGAHDDVADTVLLACELARELPESGDGSYVVIANVGHEPGVGLTVTPEWYERVVENGRERFVPAIPPPGTQARRDLAERFRSEGTLTKWMLDDDAREDADGSGINLSLDVD